MAADRTTLIVIPVRGGSVGLRRKGVRLLNGKPVLAYTLALVHDLGDVVVVTNDDEIRQIAEQEGVMVLSEPQLATPPGVHTWEPVVAQTVERMEWRRLQYTKVAVVQATSPFLRSETVRCCLEALTEHVCALTVTDDRHARIGTPRMPRQQMPPCWKVTGGCTAIRRGALTDGAWPVEHGLPIVVSGAEAIDLDTPEDWAVAELYAGITIRERLLAQVLGCPAPPAGLIVTLSAWGEQPEEAQARTGRAESLIGRRIYPSGGNTFAEATQVIANRGESDDILLVTSAYHQARTFLTFLRVLQLDHLDRHVRLWNVPAPSAMDKLQGEWAKIVEYQAKGHVASYDDGLRYLEWRDACVS